MEKSRTVKFGIIGCGVIGPWHAKAMQKVEGAELVAVADTIEERAKKLGDDYGAVYYSDYRRILEREDVDVVCICVPSGNHMEVAIDAAQAGKHILCEKPIEIRLERADRMIKAAKDNKVKLGVIFQNRFFEMSQYLKKCIDSDKFGKLISGSVYMKYYRTQGYYDSGDWRGTWELDGGGCLMNQGVHGIDLLQYLMGGVKNVFGYTGTVAHERIEVEDTATAIVDFTNGAKGVIEGSTSAYPGLPTIIEIYGEKGTVTWQDGWITRWEFKDATEEDKNLIQEQERRRKEKEEKIDRSDPQALLGDTHVPQIRDMVQVVREGKEPVCTGEDARKAVEIILAVYQSARTGKLVQLPLKA